MKKTLDLCGQCAPKMEYGWKLTKLSRPSDLKITCALCGRRRYGAVYEAELKAAGKNPGPVSPDETEAGK